MNYQEFINALRAWRQGYKPTQFQSDLFINRVMERLDEETAQSPWWSWLSGRWTIPVLGAGVAALFLFLNQPVSEPEDILLLVDSRNEYVEELSEPENALALVMEESQ